MPTKKVSKPKKVEIESDVVIPAVVSKLQELINAGYNFIETENKKVRLEKLNDEQLAELQKQPHDFI